MFVFYNTINLNVQKETFHENLFDIKFCSFAILQHFEDISPNKDWRLRGEESSAVTCLNLSKYFWESSWCEQNRMTKTCCWTDVLSLNPSHYNTLHWKYTIKLYSRSCLFPPPHTSHLSPQPVASLQPGPWLSWDQIWSGLHSQCSRKVESGWVVVKGWPGLGDNSLS